MGTWQPGQHIVVHTAPIVVYAATMSAPRPAVRAFSQLETLAQLDSFRPGLRDAVEARLPRDLLGDLAESSHLTWVPLDPAHHLADALVAVLGRDDLGHFYRGFGRRIGQWPLLAPLVRTALHSLTLDIRVLAWLLGRGWVSVYRGFGEPTLIGPAADRTATLRFTGVHPAVMRYPAYGVVFEALGEGLAGAFGVRARAELHWLPQELAFELRYPSTPRSVELVRGAAP